jgi:D-arabinose 1-dehydrogenase-like Zn-dependent alcohol dehydrogenase
MAYKLGAHIYIDTESSNAANELKKLGGARVILATAPNSKAISELINGLGGDGQLIVVAGQGEAIQMSPGQLLMGRRSIRGWSAARPSQDKSEDVLSFSVITGVLPVIEVFPLEQVALAYEKMMTSKVHFRAVLKMDA